MPVYHIGLSNLCDQPVIYAGVVSKSSRLWLHKSDVTSEVLAALVLWAGEDGVIEFSDSKADYTLTLTSKPRGDR